jgi:DNA helicase HerA-like ATPase
MDISGDMRSGSALPTEIATPLFCADKLSEKGLRLYSMVAKSASKDFRIGGQGNRWGVGYIKGEDRTLRCYLATAAHVEALRLRAGAAETEPRTGRGVCFAIDFGCYSTFRFAKEDQFHYSRLSWSEPQSLLAQIAPGQLLWVWVQHDCSLSEAHERRLNSLASQMQKYPSLRATNEKKIQRIQEKAKSTLYVLDICLFEPSKDKKIAHERLARSSQALVGHAQGAQLEYTIHDLPGAFDEPGNPDQSPLLGEESGSAKEKRERENEKKEEEHLKAMEKKTAEIRRILSAPPRHSFSGFGGWMEDVLKGHRELHMTEQDLLEFLVLPDPAVHRAKYSRGSSLPAPAEMAGEVPLGEALEGGERPVGVTLAEMRSHTYLLGATGCGKTTSLKKLLEGLRRADPGACVFVFDMKDEFAEDVAARFSADPSLLYFHPVRSPLAINPLELPKVDPGEGGRPRAEFQAVEFFLDMMEKVFGLMQEARYARHVAQVALRWLYRSTDSPTFTQLYAMIEGIRMKKVWAPEEDPEMVNQFMFLRGLEDTSYLSVLSRLDLISNNAFAARLLNSTSVADEELVKAGRLAVFNMNESGCGGSDMAYLLAATYIHKIWHIVLRLREKGLREPRVYIFIDEFGKIARFRLMDALLSEARSRSVHLVMAHQHLGQVWDSVRKSVFTNTAVKIIMRVTDSEDAAIVRGLDPDYSDEIYRSLPTLRTGQAIMFLSPQTGEDKLAPVLVEVGYPREYLEEGLTDERKKEAALASVCQRMRVYAPPEASNQATELLLNPVKYFGDRLPGRQEAKVERRLYEKVKTSGLSRDENSEAGSPWEWTSLSALAAETGIPGEELRAIVNGLIGEGKLELDPESVKPGTERRVRYRKGLFGALETESVRKATCPSREGLGIALAAWLELTDKGCGVVAADQSLPGSKPDLVAVAYDAKGRPDLKRAIAVEVESPEEVRRHPEQVIENMVKPSTYYFHEVQVWTLEDDIELVTKMRDSLSDPTKRAKVTLHLTGRGELDYYLALFQGRAPPERKIPLEEKTGSATETQLPCEPKVVGGSRVVLTARMGEELLRLRPQPGDAQVLLGYWDRPDIEKQVERMEGHKAVVTVYELRGGGKRRVGRFEVEIADELQAPER